jgi:hypothetical protein
LKNKYYYENNIQISTFCNIIHYSQVSTSISNVLVNSQTTVINCNTIDFGSTSNNTLSFFYKLQKNSASYCSDGNLKIILKYSSSTFGSQRGSTIFLSSIRWDSNNRAEGYITCNISESEVQVSGGSIYLEYSDCNNNKTQSCEYPIIKTPPPSFSFSPPTLGLACGDISARSFTVTPSNIPSGANVTYQWSYNNNWTLISSTSTSKTLQPVSGISLPSNVSVFPFINGVAQPSKSCTVSRADFVNNASISGNNVVCLGNSTFNLLNLGQNNTINWSLISAGNATISGQNQNNVTINATSSGAVELVATISNPCQQTRIIRKNIWFGPPLLSGSTVLDMNTFSNSTPYIDPSSSSDCPTIGLEINLMQPINEILEIQWERISQGVLWNRDYGSNGTKDTKVFIYPQGNMNFEYRVRLRNLCDWSNWIVYNYNIQSCSYDFSPPINAIEGDNFILSPVPVTNGTLQLALTNTAPWFLTGGNTGGNNNPSLDPGTGEPYVPSSVIVNVSIYNQGGILVLDLPGTTIPSTINLNSLPAGTYFINFEYQGQIESHTFVKN